MKETIDTGALAVNGTEITGAGSLVFADPPSGYLPRERVKRAMHFTMRPLKDRLATIDDVEEFFAGVVRTLRYTDNTSKLDWGTIEIEGKMTIYEE